MHGVACLSEARRGGRGFVCEVPPALYARLAGLAGRVLPGTGAAPTLLRARSRSRARVLVTAASAPCPFPFSA